MIDKAISFATRAHEGQKRKGTNLPYIFHPMEVGMIVARMTDDPEIIAAAVLHDTVEDCDWVTPEVIEKEFGPRVASIVGEESEDKSKTWQERKAHTLDSIKHEKCYEAKLIALGDKLSNIRSIHHDYDIEGDALWLRFNMKERVMHEWYYRGLCDSLHALSMFAEYEEFCHLVDHVFSAQEL